MLNTVDDYVGLATSQHQQKPKFNAMLAVQTTPYVDIQACLFSMPSKFDLDSAVGVQLDTVGQLVGIKRAVVDVTTKQQSILIDDVYRVLLKAKIGANHWDGTIPTMHDILQGMFPETKFIIQDHQDMSMTIAITGNIPAPVYLSIFTGGYLPLRPSGVLQNRYVTSRDGSPIFGFDIENDYISGFEVGAFAINL